MFEYATFNAPWFFNRLWRYISSVLTYLLTYYTHHTVVKNGAHLQITFSCTKF